MRPDNAQSVNEQQYRLTMTEIIAKRINEQPEPEKPIIMPETDLPHTTGIPLGGERKVAAVRDGDAQDEMTRAGVDENDDSFRYRLKDPSRFEDGSFRTIVLKKSKPIVKAVIGRLKGKSVTTLQTLIFPKDQGWDSSKVRKWVSDHRGSLKRALTYGLKVTSGDEPLPGDPVRPAKGNIPTGGNVNSARKQPAEEPAGSKAREKRPDHVFLMPGSKKYPVKRQGKNGNWKYSCKDIRDAISVSNGQGDKEVNAKARRLLVKYCGGGE